MKKIAAVLFLVTVLIYSYAYADIQCGELVYSNPNYINNMEQLAIEAKLPDNYFGTVNISGTKGLLSSMIQEQSFVYRHINNE